MMAGAAAEVGRVVLCQGGWMLGAFVWSFLGALVLMLSSDAATCNSVVCFRLGVFALNELVCDA